MFLTGHFFLLSSINSERRKISKRYIRSTLIRTFMPARVPHTPCCFSLPVIVMLCLAMVRSSIADAQFWQSASTEVQITHQYQGGFLGGGLSAADCDKDGMDDLLFCQQGSNAILFKGTQELLEPSLFQLQNIGEIKQFTWVDFDNDGDRDLSMTGLDMPVQLFRRDSVSLTPLPVNSGISDDSIVSYGHSWGDYDRDGDLDLFVCNYDAAFMGFVNSDNQLYRNEGNGFFTDVTLEAGFAPMVNYTFMALWMDYNRDLFPDLLVINDRYEVPNYFYHNNGDGTFTEIGAQANLDDYMFGMTATADDFDNDGDLDIYITNGTSGNKHKVNNGDGTFTDADEILGTTLNRFCWAAQFIDADRDGLQDLHICSTPHINLPGQNFLYRNYGDFFIPATENAGIESDGGWSRASAVADFNGDGLADMAICKSAPSISSVWSAVPNSNHWLKVTLEGVASNRDGVSSWIDCYTAGNRQSRYTYCGEGYLGQNSFSEFFGLGSSVMVDSLVVSWPSGVVDRWFNIPANQQLFLVEGTSRRVEITASEGLLFCADGAVSLSVDDWDDLLWSTGSSNTEVSVGETGPVWVLAMDEWGNQFVSDTLMVTQSPSPFITPIVQDVSCFGGSNGSIELLTDVDGLFYSVGGQPFFQSNLDGLTSGMYSITWVDTAGCSGFMDVQVNEPEEFQVDIVSQNVTCHGASDGSVAFSFAGGTPDYVLLGENSLTTELGPGVYIYALSDANGCMAIVSATIAEPEPLIPEITQSPEIDGSSNGAVMCAASGGTAPYSFYLDSTYAENGSWMNLSAGQYELLIADGSGCSILLDVQVESVNGVQTAIDRPMLLFPNPMVGEDILIVDSPIIAEECNVYNSNGSLVFKVYPASHRFSLNVSHLASGFYTLDVSSASDHLRARFMVVD